eukprot:SAG22_NODE_772_length_7314_cov_14.698545_6_plen_97_part_00
MAGSQGHRSGPAELEQAISASQDALRQSNLLLLQPAEEAAAAQLRDEIAAAEVKLAELQQSWSYTLWARIAGSVGSFWPGAGAGGGGGDSGENTFD